MSAREVSFGRRMRRYREIVSVLSSEGVLGVFRGRDPEATAEVIATPEGEESHSLAEDRARRIRRAFERLGPTFIKAGQMLSTRKDIITPELADELARLKDDVPTVPFGEIKPVIERQLGMRLENVFSEFDEEPLASASIAQVYAATLKDGSDVVVKVQRPGVTETMLVDLDIMDRQAERLTNRSLSAQDVGLDAIVSEMTARLRDEIDYREESRSLARFREAFADDDRVYFPRPYPELSTSSVLVMERLRGIPGTDTAELDAAGVDRRRLAEIGVDCYLTQFFEIGFFHADPHEGNIFAMPDGKVAFVDFGRVASLTDRDRMRALRLVGSIAGNDPAAMTETILEVATAPNEVRVLELQRDLEQVLDAYDRRRQRGESGLVEFSDELLGAMRAQRIVMPARLVWLLTTIGILEGVASNLSPGFDTIGVVGSRLQDIVQKTFDAEDLQSLLQRWGTQYWQLIDEMPLSLHRTMRRAADGEFQIAVRPVDYDRLIDRIEELTNRIAFALLALGLIVAWTAIALTLREEWSDWMAVGGMVFALLLLGTWLWRSRKKRRQRDHEARLRERRR